MRTKNLFKVFAMLVAFFCFAGVSFSQSYLTTAGYEPVLYPTGSGDGDFIDTVGLDLLDPNYTELVTVGSKMPYVIRQDPSVGSLIATGVYLPSVFYISVGIGAATPSNTWSEAAFNITDTTGDALSLSASGLLVQRAEPFTLDSTYAITWLTTGARKIWMYEYPVSNVSGVTTCDGIRSTLGVTVYPKPTMDWTDNGASLDASPWIAQSCGNVNVNINVDYIGYDDVRIVYDSTYTNISGVAVSTGRDSTEFAGSFGVQNSNTNQLLTNWKGDTERNGSVLGTPRYGYVTYTIAYVNDPISRKSLKRNTGSAYAYGGEVTAPGADVVLATGGLSLDAANIPSHTYRVYNLPTPTARPIKHLTNTGW